MEGVTDERRGEKRQLDAQSRRWQTPEEAEEEEKEADHAVEREKDQLQRSMATLIQAVEANAQMEAQERMQLQQDKEVAVIRAAAEIQARSQGQGIALGQREEPAVQREPNPRLELAIARNLPSPSGSELSQKGGPGGKEEAKDRSRRRRRKSTSRSPRGRFQDSLD